MDQQLDNTEPVLALQRVAWSFLLYLDIDMFFILPRGKMKKEKEKEKESFDLENLDIEHHQWILHL
jgi:hypothetical protein